MPPLSPQDIAENVLPIWFVPCGTASPTVVSSCPLTGNTEDGHPLRLRSVFPGPFQRRLSITKSPSLFPPCCFIHFLQESVRAELHPGRVIPTSYFFSRSHIELRSSLVRPGPHLEHHPQVFVLPRLHVLQSRTCDMPCIARVQRGCSAAPCPSPKPWPYGARGLQ